MNIFDRKPALRWVTPLAFLAVVGGTGGLVATATADNALPPMSAADLLVHLQQSKVDHFSGTIVEDSDLGLPSIPGAGDSEGASLSSLVSGSHTMDVWYAGPDQARLRVQGRLDESDVIVNGKDFWSWSYKKGTATHRTLSAPAADETAGHKGHKAPADLPKTPQEAADRVLSAVSPTTTVTTERTKDVAGQQVYELVLSPNEQGSLISQVRIAVDGDNYLPLRVQVIAGDDPKPAFQVYYTKIDFGRPDAGQFDFKAPPGTKVTEAAPEKSADKRTSKAPSKQELKAHASDAPKVIGKGWTSVVVSKLPAGGADQGGQLGQLLRSLPERSGSWGKGRVFSGKAFTAVLTDDGRLAVGSVDQATLLSALDK